MRILAIETSCDETSIAIADFSRNKVRVLSHIVLSQIPVHKKFGGVVPNLAKREHQKNLVPILLRALGEAGFKNSKCKMQNSKLQVKIQKILEREPELLRQFKRRVLPSKAPPVDAIAVTYGPGLAPALWVGVNFAKALAVLWDKPLIPVNHMLGHLYSALVSQIDADGNADIRRVQFPALALLVSGGHTELVLVKKNLRKSASGLRKSAITYTIIGETLDDAAGEAFDKVARILGLVYPGGPEIFHLVETYAVRPRKLYAVGPRKIKLPRPMLNSGNYNFSFSGLKTAALYLVRDLGPQRAKKLRPLIAKEFQDAAVDVLVAKTIRAAKEYRAKTLLLGGGVAANRLLRQRLSEACKKELPHVVCHMSDIALSGDNALMIAMAAYFSGKKKAWNKIQADANARLTT